MLCEVCRRFFDCERIELWRILLNQMPKGQDGKIPVNLSGKRTKVFVLYFCQVFFRTWLYYFKGVDFMLDKIAEINGSINGVVWGVFGLALLIGTGIIVTLATKVFQITHIGHWWKNTIASVFK